LRVDETTVSVQPFQSNPAPAPNANALAGWMANPNPSSSVPSGVVAASPFPMQPSQGIIYVTTYKCLDIMVSFVFFSYL